jgi:hypothetical protein
VHWPGNPSLRLRAALWAALAVGTSAAAPLLHRSIEAAAHATDLAFTPRTFDFGSVRAGTNVDAEFAFVNEAKGPVRILGVRGTCGCLRAEASATDVPPGGSGTVKATLSTTGRQGKQTFRVHVRTDEGKNGGATLLIRGEIRIPLRPVPHGVAFGSVEPGSRHTQEVRVEKLEAVPEVSVTAHGEGLTVERVSEDEKALVLRVTVDVPWSRITRGCSVTLTTGDCSTWVPVVWHIPPPFDVSVRQLELRDGTAEMVAKPRWPSVKLARVNVRNLPIAVKRDGDRITFTLEGPAARVPWGAAVELVPEPATLGNVRVPIRVGTD